MRCSFYAQTISDYLYQQTNPQRKDPLYLGSRVNVKHSFIIEMPETWSFDLEGANYKHDKVSFSAHYGIDANVISAEYHYIRDTTWFAAEQAAVLFDLRSKIADELGFYVSHGSPTLADVKNYSRAIVLGLVGCLAFFVLSRKLYRYDPAPHPDYTGPPKSIGGWLILPAIGVTLSPFVWLVVGILATEIDLYTLATITNFKSDAYARRLLILFYVLSFAIPIVDTVLVNAVYEVNAKSWQTTATDAAQELFSMVIWIPYLLISKRVRQTFGIRFNSNNDSISPSSALEIS